MAETLTPLATTADLEAFWRSIAGGEVTRAERLLKMASNYLRQIARNNCSDIDKRVAGDESGLFLENVRLVILSAVKRAMLTPEDAPPADSWSQSASPYSETMKFTNPANDLYFKKSELQLLGIGSVSGRSQFGVLRGVR